MQTTGQSSREALDTLIDLELLAQEARSRGLGPGGEPLEAAKDEAVYQLLARTFEKSYTPERIPEAILRKAYRLNIKRFVHPSYRRFRHILVRLPDEGSSGRTDEKEAMARVLAGRVHELAVRQKDEGGLDAKTFEALADRIRGEGFGVLAESGVSSRDQLVKPFADELFELERPGDIGGPVETRFGIHVIYLVEKVPEKNVSFEQARPTVKEKVFPQMRRRAFRRWLKKIRDESECRVEMHPERIPIAGGRCGSAVKSEEGDGV
jgi:hypothetical protein